MHYDIEILGNTSNERTEKIRIITKENVVIDEKLLDEFKRMKYADVDIVVRKKYKGSIARLN